MSKPRVRLLSISDCRDKTGIVTFIKIFREKHLDGALQGYQLAIDCYRDFEGDRSTLNSAPAVAHLGRGGGRARAIKMRLKEALLRNAFGAFLLFALILCKRGMVVAIKSRLRGTADLYFHQDFLTAFWGRLFLPAAARNILVLHSGVDPLRQLFIVFGGMRGTGFERAIRKCFASILRKQDTVVTLSQALATELRSNYGIERVRCVYNTAEPLDYVSRPMREQDAPLELVAVGSLQYVKGFDILLQAIALLEPAKAARIRLTIVGEGEERKMLEALIASSGLSASIRLVGNSNDVASHLGRADLFVLSSRDEGMPMAVLEAMQVGLPLISTRVGTIPEVLDDSACLFVEKSPTDIARALDDVLDGNHDLVSMSRAIRATYDRKLSMELFLNGYLSAFDELCARDQAT